MEPCPNDRAELQAALLGSDQGKWLNRNQKGPHFGGEIGLERAIFGSKMGFQATSHGSRTLREGISRGPG
jgi:hypothetical protein